MANSDAFIDIRAVSKRFGSVTAVDGVDLAIRQGEFFSLLGASGCGKTTLLRMIAGFEMPTEGDILIDGQVMTDVPANRRPTNMVFQNYAIFPHLTVRDNIAYGLRKDGLPRADLDRKVDAALEMIKLSGYGARRSTELSGGQRQRVALARALIKRPKVLLLDEPLGALDKKLRETMQLELRQIQDEIGITFVFVTHDQEEALTMSCRVAVMAQGRVMQVATPRELYETPNSRAVASFIGTMNFFEATTKGIEGERLLLDAQGLGGIAAPVPGWQVNGKAVVAIRPEKLQLSLDRPQGEVSAAQGTILNSTYLGDRSHFHVRLDGVEAPIAVSAQNVERSMRDDLDDGTPVWLSWRDTAMVVLPG
ncbi:MAG: ABC transporter ATP-binding protein [Alphaproteobacteria bacterium]|nr:ABC transporter ATP-binding protein [Alphaproteobacteria bacterium]MBU0797949.1 ABC transporter ATP-binding protein [Alphaproteobacteria bacterium]MBU1812739.1 ABC transporter ATP-binding protein [Alphaproteobacteria bacterium]MBU2091898.1 ABC transporter ATP-binding protein [Alphaproteobacteria bacterium]